MLRAHVPQARQLMAREKGPVVLEVKNVLTSRNGLETALLDGLPHITREAGSLCVNQLIASLGIQQPARVL